MPDALKGEYKEIEGNYVVNLEGIDAHPSVANLKTAQ